MSQTNKQPRVFVVDDEDVIASTVAMIQRLEDGFQAGSFTSPLDALKAARLEAPNLLISDVVMPQLSGIELAIQVREHCAACKVLLSSGQAQTASLLETAPCSSPPDFSSSASRLQLQAKNPIRSGLCTASSKIRLLRRKVASGAMRLTPITGWHAFPGAKGATERVRIRETKQVCGLIQLQDGIGEVPRHLVSGFI